MAFLAGLSALNVGMLATVSLDWGRVIRAALGAPFRAVGGLFGVIVGLLSLSHVLGTPIAPIFRLPVQ